MVRINKSELQNKIFSKRLIFSFLLIAILTIIIVIRIYNLQVTKHEFYKDEALGNQMSIVPTTPTRGKIFSCHP